MTDRQHIAWYARARSLRDLSFAEELAGRVGAVLDGPARELSKGSQINECVSPGDFAVLIVTGLCAFAAVTLAFRRLDVH